MINNCSIFYISVSKNRILNLEELQSVQHTAFLTRASHILESWQHMSQKLILASHVTVSNVTLTNTAHHRVTETCITASHVTSYSVIHQRFIATSILTWGTLNFTASYDTVSHITHHTLHILQIHDNIHRSNTHNSVLHHSITIYSITQNTVPCITRCI